jgi:predicted hydrocarbon binding protein
MLHSIGMEWGLAHTVRVESFVQKERSSTLGELEIQVALEYLSGSLAVIGLGLFEVDLSHRQRGVVVIDHRASPFPTLVSGIGGRCCHLLAGFHAGVLSYLSGRALRGYEMACSFGAQDTCRFLIATDSRLHALQRRAPSHRR